jgi:hypothetical protein
VSGRPLQPMESPQALESKRKRREGIQLECFIIEDSEHWSMPGEPGELRAYKYSVLGPVQAPP